MESRLFEKLFGVRYLLVIALVLLLLVGGFFIVRSFIPTGTTPTQVAVLETEDISPDATEVPATQPPATEPPTQPPAATPSPTAAPTTAATTAATAAPVATTVVVPPDTTTGDVAPAQVVFGTRQIVEGRYTVQSGDNLPVIAQDLCGSQDFWLDICSANSGIIEDCNLIHPGQVLSIPCQP